jgi:hypothetical protein
MPPHDALDPMTERSLLKVILALGATALVLVGLWYLISRSDDSADSSPQGGRSRVAQLGAYRALRGPEEKAPSYVEASIRQGLGKSHGSFRAESSHLVHTTAGGIWVVTGRVSGGSVGCVVQASRAAVSCAPAVEMARNGLALGIVKHPSRPPHTFLVLGIAPDWVRTVRAKIGAGTDAAIRAVAVRGNAYAMSAHVPILIEGFCGAGRGCEHLTPVHSGG